MLELVEFEKYPGILTNKNMNQALTMLSRTLLKPLASKPYQGMSFTKLCYSEIY